MQFTSQTSQLLNKAVMLIDKPTVATKELSSAVELKEQSSESKPLPPSIVASTVSLRSAKPPPPYSEAAYDNHGYVDDAVPGPSSKEGITLDVPAVPQRKVCFYTCYIKEH